MEVEIVIFAARAVVAAEAADDALVDAADALLAAAVAEAAEAVALFAAAVADAAESDELASIAASVSVDTTGSPELSKPRTFDARVDFRGSVISMDVGSVTGALIARSASSDVCCANIV